MWSSPGNNPPNEHNRCPDGIRGSDRECGWEPYYQLGVREGTVNEGYRSSRKIMHGALKGSLRFIPSAMGGY